MREDLPACDRCGSAYRFTVLTGFPTSGEMYMLCPECQAAIVLSWLDEHAAEIGRERERRAGRSDASNGKDADDGDANHRADGTGAL